MSREQQTVETISNAINSFQDEDVVGRLLSKQHRTLQQNTMRLVVGFIEGMASNGSDLRNENAVKLAKKLKAALEEVNICLPVV